MSVNNFASIQVSLASPDRIHEWSHGEVKEAGNDQLPFSETGTGRIVL